MLSLHYIVYTALLTLSPVLASTDCTPQVLQLQEINYNLSRTEGATIETITAITVATAEECAAKCCQESENNCTVGMFDKYFDQQNCLLMMCEPLSACSFQASNKSLDLIVAMRNKQLMVVPPKITNGSSEENISLDMKSSAKSNVTSSGTSNASLENDSGLLAKLITTNSSSELSHVRTFSENHKAKQNFTKTDENVVLNTSNKKSTLNPNSNLSTTTTATATKENAPLVLVSTSTFASSSRDLTGSNGNTLDVDKNKGSKPRKGVLLNNNNDYTDLHNIFKEDNGNETDQPSNTSLTGKETSSLNDTNSDRILSEQNKVVVTTHVAESDASKNRTSSPVTETRNETNSTASAEVLELNTNSSEVFKPTASVESMITSSAVTEVPFSFIPSSSNPPGSSKPSKPSTATSKSPTSVTGKSASNASFDISFPSASVTSLAASNGSTEPSLPINVNKMTIENDSDRDEWHAKAKFHLVIALVLGLLLLLTVVGLILRRIYDVWQRRHYQRMDFLIDGLYNSVNT